MKETEQTIGSKIREVVQRMIPKKIPEARPKVTFGRNCVIFNTPSVEKIPLPSYASKVKLSEPKVYFGKDCVVFNISLDENNPLPAYTHKTNSTTPHQKENIR